MEAIVVIAILGNPKTYEMLLVLAKAIVDVTKNYKNVPAEIEVLQNFCKGIISGVLKLQGEQERVMSESADLPEEVKGKVNQSISKLKSDIESAEKLLKKCTTRDGRFDGSILTLWWRREIKSTVRSLREQENSLLGWMNYTQTFAIAHPRNRLCLEPKHFRIIGGDTAEKPGDVLPNSNIRLVYGNLSNTDIQGGLFGTRKFILEGRAYDHDGYTGHDQAEKDIKTLAQKLAKSENQIRIPLLVGYRHAEPRHSYELVFALPPSYGSPKSLHSLLLDATRKAPSLTYRLNICKQLANAILFAHNLELVHKNIRPENVILLPRQDDNSEHSDDKTEIRHFETLLLTNWELVRHLGDATSRVGHDDWKRGIYQHPKRQGKHIESDYSINHDIYSLGVCMLEIFLWRTFVEDGKLSQLYQDRAVKLRLVTESTRNNAAQMTRKPSAVYKVLVDIAETELPFFVGDYLTKLVLDCLKYGENGFGGQNTLVEGEIAQVAVDKGPMFVRDFLDGLSRGCEFF
ncbi:hypothetical protein RUND412_007992 [Rhizina undulata]